MEHKNKKNLGHLVTLISLLLLASACQNKMEFSGASVLASETDFTDNGKTCTSERWTQSATSTQKKLDLLFVTDTSGSITADAKRAMAEGARAFIQNLNSNSDVNIAVIPAFYNLSDIYAPSGHEKVISLEQYLNRGKSIYDAANELYSRLMSVTNYSESLTDGGEAGLAAFKRLSSEPLKSKAQSYGFFREEASLAVVFISDENDICAQYPIDVQRVRDPQGTEMAFLNNYCSQKNLWPSQIADYIRQQWSDRKLLVSSLVYVDPNRVGSGIENEVGYGYLEFTEKFAGGLIDLSFSPSQIEQALAQFGAYADQQTSFKSKLDWSAQGRQIQSLKVDGRATEYLYDSNNQVLEITGFLGQEGSSIELISCRP